MFVIAFLPRSKHLLVSWLQSPSAVILEPKTIKSVTVSIVSPSVCQVMELNAMIFVFRLWTPKLWLERSGWPEMRQVIGKPRYWTSTHFLSQRFQNFISNKVHIMWICTQNLINHPTSFIPASNRVLQCIIVISIVYNCTTVVYYTILLPLSIVMFHQNHHT